MTREMLDAAILWHAAGACVLPAAADGSKQPAIKWRQYQHKRPSLEQVQGWFTSGAQGMGVVCGAVSGGLELVEFEQRAMAEGMYEQAEKLFEAAGLGELWGRVTGGYTERSPSGGRHFFWRVTDGPVPGNAKLGRRLATREELADSPDRLKVLVETRGEGGWVVTAPSNGATHPSGQPWVTLCGSPADIATITGEQRDELIRVLRQLDQVPAAQPAPTPRELADATVRDSDGSEVRPGDDYNARASWDEILVGWTRLYEHGGTTYWRRPGKSTPGLSATTGHANDADRLYVFSSATEFEPETPYSKFGAYALLNFGGDHAAAASELRRQGYGSAPIDPAREQYNMISALVSDFTGVASIPIAVPTGPPAEVKPVEPAKIKLSEDATEQDVADWIVQRYRDRLFYVAAQKRFYYWNGQVWAPQDDYGLQFEIIRAGCEAVPGKRRQKWGSHITSVNIKCRLERHPGLRREKSELDPHPHLLNTPSGIVDLRTGETLPHDPALLCTRITRYAPDPAARAPRFATFLEETFPTVALLAFIQTLLGYCLFGHNREQVFVIAHGVGRNGKSLLLETIMRVLGSYASKGDSDWLMVRQHGPHTEEIASIEGLRFMYYSEIGERNKLDERRVKELSGGETIRSRKLYQGFEDFDTTCTMVLIANELPKVGQGGDSLWRRVRALPFTHQVPTDRVDVTLPELFRTPEYGAAILAWLITGAVNYQLNGLINPAEVNEASDEFRREAAGPLATYVDERLILGGGAAVQIPKAILYEDYRRWCLTSGDTPMSKEWFGRRLIDSFGIGETRTSSQRFWTGVCLAGQ